MSAKHDDSYIIISAAFIDRLINPSLLYITLIVFLIGEPIITKMYIYLRAVFVLK